MTKKTIVWFRHDLRISDNPALYYGATTGAIIPVYIFDAQTPKAFQPGGASRWWLHHSLLALKAALHAAGVPLILRSGVPLTILRELASEYNADAVCWNRVYEPYPLQRDANIQRDLEQLGIHIKHFNASLLFDPAELRNKQGRYFKVFTPFWKHCLTQPPPNAPLPAPPLISTIPLSTDDRVEEYALLPTAPDWSSGIRKNWQAGEHHAMDALTYFLDNELYDYTQGRDIPSRNATSHLSPYLHFGEISPRQIWYAAHQKAGISSTLPERQNRQKFLTEIGWREFSYHLLYHVPTLTTKPFYPAFEHFRWQENPEALKQWQKGQTGYPLVDAGMRQLWQTGYMHNRVRMVVASFLTKHLLIHWKHGAAWFWDTLVDADLANNTASWQWVAGCGADAAPYFRIFNPVLQSKRFDPNGDYIKRWVPELSGLTKKYIHAPWEMGSITDGYPPPMVDHALARERALAMYQRMNHHAKQANPQ